MKSKQRIKFLKKTNVQFNNNKDKIIKGLNQQEKLHDMCNFNKLMDTQIIENLNLTISSDTSMDISTTMSLSTLSFNNSKEEENQFNYSGFNKTMSVFKNHFNDTIYNLQNNISPTNSNAAINTSNYFNSTLLQNKNTPFTNVYENIRDIKIEEPVNKIVLNNKSLKWNDSIFKFENSLKNNSVSFFENICFKQEINKLFFIEYTSNYKKMSQIELICYTITWIQSRLYEIILLVPKLKYLHQYTLKNNYLAYNKLTNQKRKLPKTVGESNNILEVIEALECLDISFYKKPLHRYMLTNELLGIYCKFVSLYISYYNSEVEKMDKIFEESQLLYNQIIESNDNRTNAIYCLNNFIENFKENE